MHSTDVFSSQWWRWRTPGEATLAPAPRNGADPEDARGGERMRQAEAQVRAWVMDLRGAFDAGSGATFDQRLNGLASNWHAQDDKQHARYVEELDLRIAAAQRDHTRAVEAVGEAESTHQRAERDFDIARERLGGERLHAAASSELVHRPPGGPYNQQPELLHGASRDVLMWAFVLGAIVGDLAAFNVVLKSLFRTDTVIVWAGTVGFAAAAIGVCHLIGVGLRQRRSGDRHCSNGLLWAWRAGWLGLGGTAFVARLAHPVAQASFGTPSPGNGTGQDLISALTFAGLYFVSGLIAIAASYYTSNPAARAYRRASRTLQQARQQLTSARGHEVEQVGRLKAVEAEKSRAPQRRRAIYRGAQANIVALKIVVRTEMAAQLQDPSALPLLMKDAPDVEPDPESGAGS
ncbi:MAG TPA: hypothetical protein VJ757_10015 [Pseudonocardiaceae bacterium]|nr:hypothetical protein [Pseudonocardiaceae bacterium]